MANGYFALVLHAHLPFVRHPEDPTVMEEQWLYEAITGTYLPLIQMFEGLIADHVPFRCTVSLSAPLITMLTDDLLKVRYAAAPGQADRAGRKGDRPDAARAALPAAGVMYADRFRVAAPHLALPRRRSGAGLPPPAGGGPRGGHHLDGDPRLLPGDGPQLGQHPRPGPRRRRSLREALRPPPARHVAGRVRLRPRRRRAAARGGRPLLLRRHARHPVRRPAPAYGVYAPLYCPTRRGRLRPRHGVVRAGLERAGGLPGRQALPRLLPRHRLRPAARVHQALHPPGRAPDVHRHQVPRHHPQPAARQVGLRSGHRARQGGPARLALPRQPREAGAPPARRRWTGRPSSSVRTTPSCTATGGTRGRCSWATSSARCTSISTTSRRSRRATTSMRYDTNQVATPCASSWGAKGYNDYWINETNAWTYRHLHVAGERMVELARRHPSADPLTTRALNQAARELMLAQSSDWTFIMRTGTTVPYATKRINQHIVQFNKLYDDLRGGQGERALAGRRRVAEQHFPADRLPYLRQLIRWPGPPPFSRFCSSLPSAPPSPRPAGWPTSRARCRRRCARWGIDVRVVMPLYAGMPWNELDVAGRPADGADVVGLGAGARAPRQAARQRRPASTAWSSTATSTGPICTGRPAEGYPDNLERFTFLSRGSLELCKALGFIPDVIHCNDWQTALVPVYVNTVEWMQPLHAAATDLLDPQPGLPGRVRRRRHVHHRPRAASTTTRASSSTSAP